MIKELTCIVCPMGCRLKVEQEGDEIISVEGNTCIRGENYAKTEIKKPMRVITTTVRAVSGELVPVKTDGPVPKGRVLECMERINTIHPEKEDCFVGGVVCEDLLGLGVAVVVTAPVSIR